MKKRILRYLKHIGITFLALLLIAISIVLHIGASVHYADHPLKYTIDNEGPYIFYTNNSTLNINYLKGNRDDGFYVDSEEFQTNTNFIAKSHFQIDDSSFDFEIFTDFKTDKSIYMDENPIIAISDIEGGYMTFRDFLIRNKVIDRELNWIFGKGHLVLAGDFVDRGWSVTQVLWLIYKLEREAEQAGGKVHFLIGNHELKNMQGNYGSSAEKYLAVAGMLGKFQSELYDQNSLLGRWMSSKNATVLINGHLFAHGGMHPEVVKTNLSLEKINELIRDNYYIPYYPKTDESIEDMLNSNRTGVCWYRGYFKDDLNQVAVDQVLDYFNAKSMVLGHTLQSKVNRTYQGKVIGIDVKHPKDYEKSWPFTESEGLLIDQDNVYRLLSNGERIEI